MTYPGDANYGKCDDCGGAPYTMLHPGRVQVCRECHGKRVNYIASVPDARKEAATMFSDTHQWLATYTPEQLASWEAAAPKRAEQRRMVAENLAAYERGEFPANESLLRGVKW